MAQSQFLLDFPLHGSLGVATVNPTPTTHDWFKLIRMMNFLKAAVNDCLIIEMDGSGKAVCSIDAAHLVHPDARSHTGMSMKMGKGAITSMSRKQKLNTS